MCEYTSQKTEPTGRTSSLQSGLHRYAKLTGACENSEEQNSNFLKHDVKGTQNNTHFLVHTAHHTGTSLWKQFLRSPFGLLKHATPLPDFLSASQAPPALTRAASRRPCWCEEHFCSQHNSTLPSSLLKALSIHSPAPSAPQLCSSYDCQHCAFRNVLSCSSSDQQLPPGTKWLHRTEWASGT